MYILYCSQNNIQGGFSTNIHVASSKQTVGVEIEDITKYETKYAMELNPKSIGG